MTYFLKLALSTVEPSAYQNTPLGEKLRKNIEILCKAQGLTAPLKSAEIRVEMPKSLDAKRPNFLELQRQYKKAQASASHRRHCEAQPKQSHEHAPQATDSAKKANQTFEYAPAYKLKETLRFLLQGILFAHPPDDMRVSLTDAKQVAIFATESHATLPCHCEQCDRRERGNPANILPCHCEQKRSGEAIHIIKMDNQPSLRAAGAATPPNQPSLRASAGGVATPSNIDSCPPKIAKWLDSLSKEQKQTAAEQIAQRANASKSKELADL